MATKKETPSQPLYFSPHNYESLDDVIESYSSFYKPATQKKVTKTTNHIWGELYKHAEKHFEQFGRDDQGELLHTSHEHITGDDKQVKKALKSLHTEHLLHELAFVGMEKRYGKAYVDSIRKTYAAMRKSGKVPSDSAILQDVKRFIETYFGKVSGQQLEYEDIVDLYQNTDIMDAFRNEKHPLHSVFNNYVNAMNPHVSKNHEYEKRLLHEDNETRAKLTSALDKRLAKYALRAKAGIPLQAALQELQQLQNKNYQPTAEEYFEDIKSKDGKPAQKKAA